MESALTAGALPHRRFSGMRVAIVLVAIILAAIGFAMARFFATRFPTGPVHGFVALSAEDVLVFRESDNDAFSLEMVRVHREDGPAWRKGIYALQLPLPSGVTADGGIITVRAQDVAGHLETHVFSEDGKFLFRRRVFESPRPGAEVTGQSFRAGMMLYELYTSPELVVHGIPLDTPGQAEDGQGGVSPSEDRAFVLRPAEPVAPSQDVEGHVADGVLFLRLGGAVFRAGPGASPLQRLVEKDAVCLLGTAALSSSTENVRLHDLAGGGETVLPLRTGVLECGVMAGGFWTSDGTRVSGFRGGERVWQVPLAGAVGLLSKREASRAQMAVLPLVAGPSLVLLGADTGRERMRCRFSPEYRVLTTGARGFVLEQAGHVVGVAGDGQRLAGAAVAPADPTAPPTLFAALGEGRLWIGNSRDVRPLKWTTFRPQRSWANHPVVRVQELSEAPLGADEPCIAGVAD